MYIYYLVYRTHIVPPPFEPIAFAEKTASPLPIGYLPWFFNGHPSPWRFPRLNTWRTHGENPQNLGKLGTVYGFFSSKRVEKTKHKDGG